MLKQPGVVLSERRWRFVLPPLIITPLKTSSITDYIRTLENPTGVFRTLGDVEVARDVYREIELRAGNSAAVFTYMHGGQKRLLKCYTRPNPRLREIYAYIERNAPALFPEIRLLQDELYVHSLSGEEGWTDIVEGKWVDGETLDTLLARMVKATDSLHLHELAGAFDGLCRMLLAQEWAHGDLKPENIVVRPDGSPVLIDCDAVWIPEFAGQKTAELGTPGYRHPARNASHFDKRIDDWPMLLISASLHALALEPELYAKYNTTDNLIFSPEEVVGGGSAALAEILELFARSGMAREYRMTEALASLFPEVENIGGYFTQPFAAVAGSLTSFVENGRWGFADGAGNRVVPPFWDEVLEYRGHTAAARLGKWWHVIGTSGEIVSAGLGCGEMFSLRKK